jgi:hypothetical protein
MMALFVIEWRLREYTSFFRKKDVSCVAEVGKARRGEGVKGEVALKHVRNLFLVLELCIPMLAWCAFEEKPAGARCAAMGGLSVAGGGDGWGAMGNPAHLLRSRSLLIGVSVTPGLFGIPDLSLARAMVVVPTEHAGFGGWFSRFGSDMYRETEGSLSVAARLTENAVLGVSARLFHLSIAGYGSASAGTVDLGLSVQPFPACTFSLAMANCSGSSLGACDEELPRSIGGAIELRSEETLCAILELRKEGGFPMALSWGGEFTPVGGFSLRLGWTTEHPGVDAGGGILLSPIRLDYAWTWHASLGGTHTLSITIEDLF